DGIRDFHVTGVQTCALPIFAQLLSHTGGLTAEPPGEWWERTPGVPVSDLLASLGPETARHRPGRRYHYSNLGYALLGEVVARKRSAPWAQVIRGEILERVGRRDTTARPRPTERRR